MHRNPSGYCDECTARYREKHPHVDSRDSEHQKPTQVARKQYGSWKWRKFAADFIKLHPTCAICGEPSKVCDHKDMTADMMVDAYGGFDYDPSHYQALCFSCNARKGRREDREVRMAYHKDLQDMERAEAVANMKEMGAEKLNLDALDCGKTQNPEGEGRKNWAAPSTAFGGNGHTHEEKINYGR